MTTTPTDQQLRDIYRREQPHRVDWPRLYEDGMRDPVIRRLVDMLTRRQVPAFGRRKAPRGGLTLRDPVYRVTPAETPQELGGVKYPPKRELDQKQRASGEREDPDE